LEEITVQKLECSKCGHYRIGSPEKIQELAEDWKCPSCFVESGHVGVKMRTRCSTCNYTMLPGERKCHCPNNEPLFKVFPRPWKTPTEGEKIQDDIKNAKVHRKYVDKMIARRDEEKNIQKNINKNLQIIADSLSKKEVVQSVKRYSGHAIQ